MIKPNPRQYAKTVQSLTSQYVNELLLNKLEFTV